MWRILNPTPTIILVLISSPLLQLTMDFRSASFKFLAYLTFGFSRLNSTCGYCAYFNIHIDMYNNNAQIAGNAVYGGLVETCVISMVFKSTGIQLGTVSLEQHFF